MVRRLVVEVRIKLSVSGGIKMVNTDHSRYCFLLYFQRDFLSLANVQDLLVHLALNVSL